MNQVRSTQLRSQAVLAVLAVTAAMLCIATAQAAADRPGGSLADLRVGSMSEFDQASALSPAAASETGDAGPLWAQLDADSGRSVDVYAYDKKSPLGAFLRSFLIPGWGQYYVRSAWWKPVVFLGVEAASWYGVSHYRGDGHDKENVYKAFADDHWIDSLYLDGLKQVFYRDDVLALPDDPYLDTRLYVIEEGEPPQSVDKPWSHHAFFSADSIPIERDEYYENIGKYHQFNYGWDDYRDTVRNTPPPDGVEDPPDNLPDKWSDTRTDLVSPNRNTYLNMRADANKALKRATTMIVVAIANHLASGLEAALGARRYNRSLDEFGSIDADVRLVLSPATGKPMPHVTLSYRF